MLVQALAEYADKRLADQLEDPAFEWKPVRFFLQIATDGRFLGYRERTDSVVRGKKTVSVVPPLMVPKSPVSRVSGIHPLLACDDMKYVVGPGPWTQEKERTNYEERHAAFVALLRRAAAETKEPALESAVRFYDSPDQLEKARGELASQKAAAGTALCLYAEGPLAANSTVRDYWRAHYNRAFGERSQKGGEGICLISGKFGPIAATHFPVKGLGNLGGQAAGVSLMSFDKAAFRSYGWEQNANSPVSPERAGAYVLALNDLLKAGSKHRRDFAGVAFIFWTKIAPDDETFEMIESAKPAQVSALLQLDPKAVRNPDEFYFVGVSGNGGRLLVRHWYHDSLARVKGNVKAWFEGLQIANAFTGGTAEPPPFWRLLKAISRDDPPPNAALELARRALEGVPLGSTILSACLARLRAADARERLNPHRMGLIRLVTNDLTKGEDTTPMNAALDSGQTKPAYLCGRLLAIYDSLQYRAHKENVNMTVADRYYSLASTNPMAAFPRVEDLGQKHLRKLRRDDRGAMIAIEREIQQIHELLANECGAVFPGPMSLENQGRFAIGFHHQRAESMARITSKNQEKDKPPTGEKEQS